MAGRVGARLPIADRLAQPVKRDLLRRRDSCSAAVKLRDLALGGSDGPPLELDGAGGERVGASGGEGTAEIVAGTRSDDAASSRYNRKPVIDNDADLFAALLEWVRVDGDLAHEQLNDLLALGD